MRRLINRVPVSKMIAVLRKMAANSASSQFELETILSPDDDVILMEVAPIIESEKEECGVIHPSHIGDVTDMGTLKVSFGKN